MYNVKLRRFHVTIIAVADILSVCLRKEKGCISARTGHEDPEGE